MGEKIKGLLKDTFIFALGNLGSKLILFLLVPVYTNYLTTEEYGTAEFIFTISQLIVPILSVSIWEGIIRYGLKKEEDYRDVLKTGLIVYLICSCVIMGITPVWKFYKPVSSWGIYVSFYSIGYIGNQIGLNYLRVKNKTKLFAIVSVFQTLILAIANIILLGKIKIGISGYLLANILSLFAANLLIYLAGDLFSDLKEGHINSNLLKKMLIYSAPLVVNNISWWIIHSSDKIMIEAMLTGVELGLYTVATKMPSLINVFISIFTQAWGVSSIKEIENSNDATYYSIVFEVYGFLAFAASIGLSTIIKPFMNIYVGQSFTTAWCYVPLLLVAASFSAISSFFGSMLGAIQISKYTMYSTLVGGFFNVLLNYIFIQICGVWGAIIGTVIAYVVIAAMRMIYTLKYIYIKIAWKNIIGSASIAVIQAILVSANFHIYSVSIVSIMLFVIINQNILYKIYSKIKERY